MLNNLFNFFRKKSAKELHEEYLYKRDKLQRTCKHPTLSDWIDEWWAPCHSTGFKVKICDFCAKVMHRRGFCLDCSKQIEDNNIFEGLTGQTSCLDCLEKSKKTCAKCKKEMDCYGKVGRDSPNHLPINLHYCDECWGCN